jgi:hypothetical protein
MWGPVILTPVIIVGTVLGFITRNEPWGWIAAGLLALGVIEGLMGFLLHLQGIKSQIGGFSMRNFLSGPPPVLPLAYSLVGAVGLIGLVWNA